MPDVTRAGRPPVRPTERCLTDLGLSFPDLSVPLHEVDDIVIKAAQSTPEVKDAGGAERVVALTDRVWFKVKTADRRAIVTELAESERPKDFDEDTVDGSWWIGAAGHRQSDSAQHDFYETITRQCTTGKTVSTTHLLPSDRDWKRLLAESAVAWRRDMKSLVVRLIAMSLRCGQLAVAEFKQHRIKALVRADNGHDAYLAIVAEGIPDPQIIALLLDCVPDVSPDDWQAEPSPIADMNPGPAEIIWSTILPSHVATKILDLAPQDE